MSVRLLESNNNQVISQNEKTILSTRALALTLVAIGVILAVGGVLVAAYDPSFCKDLGVPGYVVGIAALITTNFLFIIAIILNKKTSPETSSVEIPAEEKSHLPITGKIYVSAEHTYAVGEEGVEDLVITKHIERIDGKPWKTCPNESVFYCRIYELSEFLEGEGSLLPENAIQVMPCCLFVHGDDYGRWKGEGELVEFYYKGRLYQLTLAQTETGYQQPLSVVGKWIMESYPEFGGYSIHAVSSNNGAILPETKQYLPKWDCHYKMHASEHEKAAALKHRFLETFAGQPLPEVTFAVEPEYTLLPDRLTCMLPHMAPQDVQLFYTDTSFALYVKAGWEHTVPFDRYGIKLDPKEYPECGLPTEFVLVLPFTETLTRLMFERGTVTMYEASEWALQFASGQS